MSDWREHHEAFQALRRALVAAQDERPERQGLTASGEPAWVEHEREVMHAEVTRLRARRGQGPVAIDRVLAKENLACGHIDYTVKYALGCADLVVDG